jgi:hypothetical protein
MSFAREQGLPPPDLEPLLIANTSLPLVWREHYVAAVLAALDSTVASALANKGFEIVVLGAPPSWSESTAALARLLGRSA